MKVTQHSRIVYFRADPALGVNQALKHGSPSMAAVDGFGVLWTRHAIINELGTQDTPVSRAPLDLDNNATTLSGPICGAFLFGYDGTGNNWDRVRVGASNADNLATQAQGVLQTASLLYGFDGATFDRIRSSGNNADNVAATALGNLNTLGFMYIWDGANWDRWNGAVTPSNPLATAATDRSGSIAVGGTSQQVMAANAARIEAWVANPSALAESIFINITGAAAVVNGQGSIEIPGGTGWSGSVTNQINVIAATAGHVYTAGER